MYISANRGCCNFTFLGSTFVFMLWQHCAHTLVRFRYKSRLVRFRKRSRFGFKCLLLLLQTVLEMSWPFVKNISCFFLSTQSWLEIIPYGQLKNIQWRHVNMLKKAVSNLGPWLCSLLACNATIIPFHDMRVRSLTCAVNMRWYELLKFHLQMFTSVNCRHLFLATGLPC